ncbi:MipA/OmpV family protein [Candidatus Albibeggiatoa sp. nov. BB20]|uniref:MipA/OmpV family protein n=1 Tax=Candidatus Albibeggiatoa sp. nov. BB20 TaxID=3162723 RepID=UPI0033654DBD
MKKQLLSFVLFTFWLTSLAYAADEPSIYRVGAIALWNTEVYQGTGSEARLLPALYLKSSRWEFNFKELKYSLIDTKQFKLSPILSLDMNGYDADDSPVLTGMEDRDFSVGLGLAAKVKLGLFDVNASIQQDISNNSDGLLADLSLGMTRPITRQLIAGFKVGATYQDSDYSNYYYGVLPSEARDSRPAYELDNTINPYVQVNAIYRLNKVWSLNSAIIYTQLDSEIEDSPIVGNGNEMTILLGITYQGFF